MEQRRLKCAHDGHPPVGQHEKPPPLVRAQQLSSRRMRRDRLRAGASYFVLVFGAGCLLGLVQVAVVVPQLGGRSAELLEVHLVPLRTKL